MTLGERWADTELSVCTQSVCNIPSVLEMSGDVIFWNVCKKPGCTIITHMYTDTRDIRKQAWVKVSHPSLECKKDLLPFKTQFPETRHMDQIVPCFFFLLCLPITARGALWKPWPAFRRHFGKHEHPVYFPRIRRGGGGSVFVCPCEREGGGGGGEKAERKREVC